MEADETPIAVPARRRFSLRFSLWTLFVLALLISLVISNLMTSWHLRRSQEMIAQKEAEIDMHLTEIEHYQDKLGMLRIKDQAKTHIIAVEMLQDMVWRWRIFVPEGKEYLINTVVGEIPPNDYPPAHQFERLESGETQLTISFLHDAQGEWKAKTEMTGDSGAASMSFKLPEEKMAWYGSSGTATSNVFRPSYGQKLIEVTQPIQLIRLRKWFRQEAGTTTDRTQPANGILVWLEPANKPDESD